MARIEETMARTGGEDTWLKQKGQRLKQEENTHGWNRGNCKTARTEENARLEQEDKTARTGENTRQEQEQRQAKTENTTAIITEKNTARTLENTRLEYQNSNFTYMFTVY